MLPLVSMERDRRGQLDRLTELIRQAEGRGPGIEQPRSVGDLTPGVIHEWYGPAGDDAGEWGQQRRDWTPPLTLLAHQVAKALERREGGWALWIGRKCWPYPWSLARLGILRRSLLIDPPDAAARLWAIDLALRCPAVVAVVADGSRLDMAGTRRLQLAAGGGARSDGGAVALLARPVEELQELSAAATRRLVRRVPRQGEETQPGWSVEVLRCKGLRRMEGLVAFELEWDHGTGAVVVPAPVGDRPVAATPAAGAREGGSGRRTA